MLLNCIFIPIDNFLTKLHNEGIRNDLDAWLTFLGSDTPEDITNLLDNYPDFKPLYNDLYTMCLNVEEVMNMFSKELQILDQNTVRYMIDELQDQLDDANETIANKDATIAKLEARIKELEDKNK
jgi:hypothetical protein